MATMKFHPRYYRRHVEPGVEWKETNTDYAYLDWEIPLDAAALVMVDVWEKHYLKDTMARADQVIRDQLAPLVSACREKNLAVIHAPGPGVAEKHPNWTRLISEDQMEETPADWPPPDFRSKSGRFKPFAKPDEPRQPEITELRKNRRLHPLIQVEADEPVVYNGEELHRYCNKNRILFLEMFGKYSVTSGDMISGLSDNEVIRSGIGVESRLRMYPGAISRCPSTTREFFGRNTRSHRRPYRSCRDRNSPHPRDARERRSSDHLRPVRRRAIPPYGPPYQDRG